MRSFREWKWVKRIRLWLTLPPSHPLREFVYLDDVSVYSLLASIVGPHTTEITDSFSRSQRDSIRSGASITPPGLGATAEATSESTVTSGRQVVRKASVQASFKALYELTRDSRALPLADAEPVNRTPKLAAGVQTSVAVDADILSRGDLVELEVELSPDPVYFMKSAFGTFLELADTAPQIASGIELPDLMAAFSGVGLVEKLLADLVPIRCRALHYVVVNVGGAEYVVRRDAVGPHIPDGASIHPLYVAGVTEEGLYWKDVRRALFASNRVRLLARLSQDGVGTSWVPVKAALAFAGLAPSLVRDISSMSTAAMSGFSGTPSEGDFASVEPREPMDAAIEFYLRSILDANGRAEDLSPESVREISGGLKVPMAFEEMRELFSGADDFLRENFGLERDPNAALEARLGALALLGPSGPAVSPTASLPRSVVSEDARYLDCEVVAIYW